MSVGTAVAHAAEALVGTRYRLHGRVPETGLDCVGLVHAALSRAGLSPRAPAGYRLRSLDIEPLLALAAMSGLRPAEGPALPGDVLLVRPGPAQHHLHVALAPGASGGARFAHAHAGLRRVAIHHGPLADPLLRHWRP
ncbi:MAG: C40 family peptidase [Erythrobacter sp.]|nr:C40 family peptidase [Erythrobacter sp.]